MASKQEKLGGDNRRAGSKCKRETLERWLLSPDRAERMAAIKQIEKTKCPEKKTLLVKSLAHNDPSIRKISSGFLERMREEITLDDIMDMSVLLNSKDPSIRLDVLATMSKVLSEDYAQPVSEILSAHVEKEADRRNINLSVTVLWAIESANRKNRSFKKFIDFLEYDNRHLQKATMNAIGRYSGMLTTEDMSAISNMLDDPDRDRQILALETLQFIDRPAELASTLVAFFDDIENREPSTIFLAIEVLGGMRRYGPIEDFLISIKNSPDKKYNQFRNCLDDVLADTMRFTPYNPRDAIVRKPDEAAEEFLFHVLEEKLKKAEQEKMES